MSGSRRASTNHYLPYIPAKDPLSAIPPSRHPFQVWAMAACVLSGVSNLVESQGSLAELLPTYAVKLWALTFVVGGTLAILGAFWRDRVLGLLMERLAMVAISLAFSVYGLVVLYVAGKMGVTPSALTFALGIAAGWRCLHVHRELKVLRAFMYRTMRS